MPAPTRSSLMFAWMLAILAGCTTNAVALHPPMDVCSQFDELAGRRVTVPVHLDTNILVLGENLDRMCGYETPECPACGRWWLAVECPDRYIAFAPGSLVGLPMTDPGTTDAYFCVGGSDGTPLGGASCVPGQCDRRLAESFSVTHVRSATGVLQSTPREAPAIDGRPVYLFGVESFERLPYDAAAACDPAVPRESCPCTGIQTACPQGLVCGSGPSPSFWTPVPDVCGLG